MIKSEDIIHPGQVLAKILERENMSQKELSVRTGVTEKHISTVINGKKNISASFAKKLEYALPENMSFWMSHQAEYEAKILEFEEKNDIDSNEIKILSFLKDIISFLEKKEFISKTSHEADVVLELRKFMGVSNLKVIPEISYGAAYRAQITENARVDTYVLYAWKRICERYVAKIDIKNSLDIENLKNILSDIKSLMFLEINQIQEKLTVLLAECGIAFRIVPNFRGAPVQGFISRREDGKVMLCMTLRQKRADIFWFSLFHEIGHIINGDADLRFIDFASIKNEAEEAADQFARNILIEPEAYRHFLLAGRFSFSSISAFAVKQGVMPYIVIGRLQNEGELDWSAYSDKFVSYGWACPA